MLTLELNGLSTKLELQRHEKLATSYKARVACEKAGSWKWKYYLDLAVYHEESAAKLRKGGTI